MSSSRIPIRSSRRTKRDMFRPQHISKLLPRKECPDTDSDDLWPKSDESSFVDDVSGSSAPIFNFSSDNEDQPGGLKPHRPPEGDTEDDSPMVSSPASIGNNSKSHPSGARGRTPIRNVPSAASNSADKSTKKEIACPYAKVSGSWPQALLGQLLPGQYGIRRTLGDAREVRETGTRCSSDMVGPTPGTNTLRRCWGALVEALDDLGDIWDGNEDDSSHKEADSPGADRMCSVSTPATPAKHSPDKFVTPQSRLRPSSGKSRPSHYDTLTSSPIAASRSSKRGRKPRLRHNSPTPVRRKHELELDPAYSTEDESSDPYSRLKNKFLHQGPPHLPLDNFYVFMYKQDSRTGSVDPASENNKPNASQDQERWLFDRAEVPVSRRRAPIASALQATEVGSARQSLANLVEGVCQDGTQLSENTSERLHEVDPDENWSDVAQDTSSRQGSQHAFDVTSMDRLRGSRTHSTDRLLNGSNKAVGSSTDQASGDAFHDRHATTSDDLREDVEAIFNGHANGKRSVNRKNSKSKRRVFGAYLKEALRPRHPDPNPYIPPIVKNDAEPKKDSSFRISDGGTVHERVEHPPTLCSNRDLSDRLTEKSRPELPEAELDIDGWARHAALHSEHPVETLLDEAGLLLSLQASSSEVREEGGAPRRTGRFRTRPRRPESCIILSAAVPPERDLTDLLITPFIEFHPDPAIEPAGVFLEGTLMSAYGISCDEAVNRHDILDSLVPADGAMVLSAAMGSMSELSRSDTGIRRKTIDNNRAKLDNANANNTSWHKLDEASRTLDSGISCKRRSMDFWEDRATYRYNLHCMFHGTTSPDPVLTIRHFMARDRSIRGLQKYMRHA